VFRWAFRSLVLAIVLAVGLLLLKDTIARNLAETRIRQETGFDVKIEKLEFSLFAPVIRVENLVLYNPPEFGGSRMLDISDLHLEYDRGELPFQRVRLKFVRLSIQELHIVESQQGRTNLIDLLHKVSPQVIGAAKTNQSSFKGVDMLNLSVAKIRYSNLRLPRRNQEVNLGLRNEIVRNLRSEEDLAAVLFRVLLRAGVTIYTDSKKPVKLPGSPPA
jgi:hypothetical protein